MRDKPYLSAQLELLVPKHLWLLVFGGMSRPVSVQRGESQSAPRRRLIRSWTLRLLLGQCAVKLLLGRNWEMGILPASLHTKPEFIAMGRGGGAPVFN